MVFEGRDPQLCTFGLSGCRVKPRRLRGRWGFTRQPENSKRAHLRVPAGTEDSGNREGEVHEKHDGLRAQKRLLQGERPAPLSEVAGRQAVVTVVYVAAPVPLLVVPSMAGGDSVDGITLKFFLEVALPKKQKEEDESEE